MNKLAVLDLNSESEESDFWEDIVMTCLETKKRKKKMWMSSYLRNRKQFGEFHKLVNDLDEEKFKNYFRLSRIQFYELHNLIYSTITRQNTNFRAAIGTEERLAICLRFLATGNSYKSIAYNYRVSPKTVSRCVKDVCRAIWVHLQQQYLPDPTAEELQKSADHFKNKWNFDHCVGAIDGKHVVIKAPANSGTSFFNYKKTFSIVLMAIVDADYRFLAIDVGAKGRFSDGGIFSSSVIGKRIQKRHNFPKGKPLYEGGRPMPFVVVGDEAFPLLKHLMRPYPNRQASTNPRLEHFNYRLCRARRIVENAFGILASRWRVYRTPFEIPVEVVDLVVKATCVLHNFLSNSATNFSEVVTYEPSEYLNKDNGNFHVRRATVEAFDIRNAFMDYFNSPQGSLPWRK